MQRTKSIPKTSKSRGSARKGGANAIGLVISVGCPSGIGPEVALKAALKEPRPVILVGDRGAIELAGKALGLSAAERRIPEYEEGVHERLSIRSVGSLSPRAFRPGQPSKEAGRAQLLYIEEAYQLAHSLGIPLVTGPVSKAAIARSGLARARSFRGHTEWLEALDGAPYSVMCFAAERLVCSLATTHVPLARVPKLLGPLEVERAAIEVSDLRLRLAIARGEKDLLRNRGSLSRPVAVCSLNPHAGEGELLGSEEKRAILPGMKRAQRRLGLRAKLVGPLGGETAFRKAYAGDFAAVVALYHDQATIPMKLVDFGGGVNVTQGLSVVRTSVDHGTAYDIAGQGIASSRGMEEAMRVAYELGSVPRGMDR